MSGCGGRACGVKSFRWADNELFLDNEKETQ